MRRLYLILALLTLAFNLAAQSSETADSLVRLMSAQSAELMQENGQNYRKVIGPARFLHNGTYLICDTAYWDVDSHIIKAIGHVQILQDETSLTSEKLDYYINDNLAQFRGAVVQLQDKDNNVLRTRHLDYNTKDSVAVFKHGGAMRDKDGQLIESLDGSYDSKTKVFKFEDDVNMFTDTVFVKTQRLVYRSEEDIADFDYGVDAWKDSDMLSARRCVYDRRNEVFHFYDEVHGLTDVQEGWADTLHFYKLTSDLELRGNVQVADDSRKVRGMGEAVQYVDSLSRLTMSVDATIIAEMEDSTSRKDTLYMAADRIEQQSVLMCDVPKAELDASKKRLSDLDVDPVSEYRKKAAEAARKEAEEKEKDLAKSQGRKMEEKPAAPDGKKPLSPAPDGASLDPGKGKGAGGEDAGEPAGEGPAGDDAPEEPSAPKEEAKDSTKINFILATGRVRIYKSDMQARCDSLRYTDLDSLGRMYIDPVVWNEGNRQYVSDSLTVVVENSRMKRASLMSNAFITIQEDSVCFDQIRGAEMMAYFDSTTVLERFDALGGASAVFYLEENDVLATVNKVESKMLSALFTGGELQKILYFDNPHNDAYPTVQLPSEDRQMKGFKWDPDKRPAGKKDITPYDVRESQRLMYEGRPQAEFSQTEFYFPGYMKEVHDGIAARDSARAASRRMRDSLALDDGKVQPEDSLTFAEDSLSVPEVPSLEDGVKPEGETEPELSPEEAGEDAGDAQDADAKKPEALSEEDMKALEPLSPKAAKDSLRKARVAAREARWAELDLRDSLKLVAKNEQLQQKYRAKVAKQLDINEKESAREKKFFDRYVARFTKQKERLDKRAASGKSERKSFLSGLFSKKEEVSEGDVPILEEEAAEISHKKRKK